MSDDFKKKLSLIAGGSTVLILIFLVSSSLTTQKGGNTEVIHVPDVASDTLSQQSLSEDEIVLNDTSSIEVPLEVQRLQEELSQNQPGRRTERVLTADAPTFTIDDLAHLDLGFNQPTQEEEVTIPEPTDTPVVLQPNEIKVDVSDEIVSESYPSISHIDFKECGELNVPNGFQLALFALTAGGDPVIQCMGEAVAVSSCAEYSANVVASGVGLSMYVASRPDDSICSVGAAVTKDVMVLCSVEKLMDNGSGEDKTLKQWQAEFKKEPGNTFAKMYFDNKEVFENTTEFDEYDCKLYEI